MCPLDARPETRRARPCQRSKGFTLLEVLVALSIVAIAVTVVLQLFSADLRAIAASEDYVSAVLRAEERMREVLEDEGLSEKAWSETTRDGYKVDVVVSDVQKERTESLQVRLLQVNLTMRWMRGTKEKTLTLRTMKIVNKINSSTTGPRA
jgi:general secretion pathway protein I